MEKREGNERKQKGKEEHGRNWNRIKGKGRKVYKGRKKHRNKRRKTKVRQEKKME